MVQDTDAGTTAKPPEYPRREPFFALRFLRLIDALRLSAEIGENAVALLKVIAVQEDAKRYRSPVTYFNDALLRTLNFAKEERLNDARKRAVSAGWLHYGFRGNRKAGEYWVTIPQAYQSIRDECADDSCIVPDPYQEGYQAGFRAAMAQLDPEISDSHPATPEQTTPTKKGIDEGCNPGG